MVEATNGTSSYLAALNLLDGLMTDGPPIDIGGQPQETSTNGHHMASNISRAILPKDSLAEGYDTSVSLAEESSELDRAAVGFPTVSKDIPGSPTLSSDDGEGTVPMDNILQSRMEESESHRQMKVHADRDDCDTPSENHVGSDLTSQHCLRQPRSEHSHRDLRAGAATEGYNRLLGLDESETTKNEADALQPDAWKFSSTDGARRPSWAMPQASNPRRESVPIDESALGAAHLLGHATPQVAPGAQNASADSHHSGDPSTNGPNCGNAPLPATSHSVSENERVPPTAMAAAWDLHAGDHPEGADESLVESQEMSLALLAGQADEEEVRAQELEALLEAQVAELEHLRAAAAPVEEESFAGWPAVDLSMLGSSGREPLDCARVLQHTLASCDATLLDAAAQRSAELAMCAGSLGERDDPADALWAEVLAQQGQHLAALLRESRSLRAQAEVRARLAHCCSKGAADRLHLHELRSRIAVQKQLTSRLLESSSEQSLGQGSGMRQPGACGYAAGYANGLRQCDVEEALVRFRASPPHASLMHILDSRLGRAEEVERIPATLAALLQDDVAASAEALLLECARLEMVASLRRFGTAPGTPCGAAARSAVVLEDCSFVAQIQRTGALCQGLAEETAALRSGALSARSDLSSQRSMFM